MAENKSVFDVLNALNVNEHTERKNGLTYLSWAWAWAEVKKRYPDANYTVYEDKDGWMYHTDGKTCWVKVGVTINGLEHIEYLPVMDNRNRSIPAEVVTSFDCNKAVKRAVCKCLADHGCALYLYAGEDVPEEDEKGSVQAQKAVADFKTSLIGEEQITVLKTILEAHGVSEAFVLDLYKVKAFEALKGYQYEHIQANIEKIKKMMEEKK